MVDDTRTVTPFRSLVWVRKVGHGGMDETGKIALPEETSDTGRCLKGIAVKLGPKADPNIREGDGVLCTWYDAYRTIEWGDETLRCVPSRKVLCVLFEDRIAGAKPLNDYILAVWEERKERDRDIWVPEQAREAHYTAVVWAVGPEVKGVAPRDRVFFDHFGKIDKFTDGPTRFAIMRENAVLAVVPGRVE